MIRNLKIRTQIFILLFFAASTFSLIFLINIYFGSENTKLLKQLNEGYYPALEISRELDDLLSRIQRDMEYSVSAADVEMLKQTDLLRDEFKSVIEAAAKNEVIKKESIDSIKQEFNNYYPLARETVIKLIEGDLNEEVIQNLNEFKIQYNAIRDKLTKTNEKYKSEMVNKIAEVEDNHSYTLYALILIMILSGFVVGIVAIIFVKLITDPLRSVVEAANKLSIGDVDVQLRTNAKNEIGNLINSIATLANTNKELASAADAIGQGDYAVPISVRSEQDILGNAIEHMKNNLKRMTEETKLEDWYKTGQTQLNDKMRGDQSLPELSKNVISFLAKYMDARIGAIYLTEDGETLKLTGSFAYRKRKNISNTFKLGEGVVGQSALERESIIISQTPEDYIKISSGLGEAYPKNIIVFPLVYDNDLIGAIELGSFNEFMDKDLKFLEQASKNISISFKSAIARIRVKELLQQTQSQAEELQAQQEELKVTNEELQAQQEELRVANEELEEQTEKLKNSEKLLKEQQKELQKSNEELEKQTIILKERKEEIENKNVALEKARKDVEQKAKELEITSKYKSEFLANMSHELRTPMNSIQILSRLLFENKEGNLTDKQIAFAKTINTSGADLLELINEILDLSKIEAGKMTLNLDDMILNLLPAYIKQNFEHLTNEKNLYLKVELDKNLPENIYTDRQRVEQIIKNLISNAIKFTSEGGITVKVTRPTEKIIHDSGTNLKSDSSICISVNDTGIGIPEDKKVLIFQAFQQADGTTMRKYGGTGLGLSISKELSKMLKGDVYLESEEGKGSNFMLLLPDKVDEKDLAVEFVSVKTDDESKITDISEKKKKTGEIEVVAEVRDDRNSIKQNDKTILIIEDDHNFAKEEFNLIREKGYKCLIAHDGEGGLQLANQFLPSAILLDVELPRMSGWQVLEKLKGNPRTRHIPVYFISNDDKKIEAMKMGAIGFLRKPVSDKDINKAIAKIDDTINKNIKKIMIIDDDASMRNSIVDLISGEDIKIEALDSGKNVVKKLKKENFDCIVIDLGLSDINGFDLIEQIRRGGLTDIPVIVYTGKDLSRNEENILRKHAESIIIKGAKSHDRLLDEVNLFLHRIKSEQKGTSTERDTKIPIDSNSFKDKNILLVDDDVRNIFALTSVLEERGMRILVAENGREALQVLEQSENVDLILMDIMMPEMDGYEAMRQIRSKKAMENLPIIALTAKAMKGDRQKCIDAGANDYLSKPVDVEKLISLLHVWLSDTK
jgi:CheY-like chemotaxis protein/signal transduction histidine kinase/HAMP domain-containing protein